MVSLLLVKDELLVISSPLIKEELTTGSMSTKWHDSVPCCVVELFLRTLVDPFACFSATFLASSSAFSSELPPDLPQAPLYLNIELLFEF